MDLAQNSDKRVFLIAELASLPLDLYKRDLKHLPCELLDHAEPFLWRDHAGTSELLKLHYCK